MLNFNITYENVYEITKNLSHRKCVTLALYCCQLINIKNKETQLCIDLTQQWLDNPKSVTESQLRNAAKAATVAVADDYKRAVRRVYYTAANAARAAWAAANAAWVAAANAAADAARAAADAARAAAWTARAAYYARSHKSKILPYLHALTLTLPKTPYTDPFEIIVYLQDQLLYPILDNNRLNLWDPNYDYQIIGTPQQIANTLGVKNLLNA